MINSNVFSLSNSEIYQIFLYLQSLDEIKRSFIMILLHISPKELSASQLTHLAGYSKSSRYVFKSKVIESLESEKIITVTRPYPRLMLIRLNLENILMKKFSHLCQQEGNLLSEQILKSLSENLT
jgi:hypothetical protein